MNSTDAIELKEAENRFTRAKADVDGTKLAEARYQKAKKELAALRISLRGHTPHSKPQDAVAATTSLKATAKAPKKGQ